MKDGVVVLIDEFRANSVTQVQLWGNFRCDRESYYAVKLAGSELAGSWEAFDKVAISGIAALDVKSVYSDLIVDFYRNTIQLVEFLPGKRDPFCGFLIIKREKRWLNNTRLFR